MLIWIWPPLSWTEGIARERAECTALARATAIALRQSAAAGGGDREAGDDRALRQSAAAAAAAGVDREAVADSALRQSGASSAAATSGNDSEAGEDQE